MTTCPINMFVFDNPPHVSLFSVQMLKKKSLVNPSSTGIHHDPKYKVLGYTWYPSYIREILLRKMLLSSSAYTRVPILDFPLNCVKKNIGICKIKHKYKEYIFAHYEEYRFYIIHSSSKARLDLINI